MRQHMGDIAEGVLMHVEARVGGKRRSAIRDVLPVMAAGRHPQDLDDTGSPADRSDSWWNGKFAGAWQTELFFAVIPGWRVSARPGISRFRVRCFASPRNDGV